ncbi:MAG: cytochrome c biogenesis protein CcdA [Elusimicrobiota bacterium]
MVEVGLAFVAGLASFVSPCVLPLIPVYLATLSGATFDELTSKTPRRLVLINAGFFILGFSLVFIAMGASASYLGRVLFAYRVWIERLGGIALVLFGLWMVGVLKVGFLHKEGRFHFDRKPAGLLGNVLVGAAFAAGWTPCVGPQLSAILVMAGRSGSVGTGVLLLSIYSLGMALPLFLCALALERAIPLLNRIKPKLPAIERGAGILLILLGAVLAAGWFSRLATWPLSFFPSWTRFFGGLGL